VDRDGVRDELPASDVAQRRRLGDRECARQLRVERNVVVVDLARSGHRATVECEIQEVPGPGAARGHRGWRCELRRLCFAIGYCWKRIVGASCTHRYREGRCRAVRSGWYELRLTGHICRSGRGRLNEVAAATRAGRIREVDVEAVIATRLGHLALLSGVVGAGCREYP